ncbi:hypothetical protein EKO04_004000 [Ascochyta lentis]|uniref:Uncharacterized protein n=1 Tax=Ascochyta lentis TaxID=205686 RepID=A0A8H7MK76_9PLEO|nr:hypothetical protein EKO04_004000 [Ascochyta lentis]
MPLQKPSPHRFIAPHPPSTQTPKAKPKSNLRHAVTAHTPKQTPELQFKKITPAKRFVVASASRPHTADTTPRVPDRVEEPGSSASTDYTPRRKAQRKWERVESIEEASQSSPSRPPDEDALGVVQTIEHDSVFGEEHHDAERDDDDDDEILFEPHPRSKRRRTSSPTTPLRPQQQQPESLLPSLAPHRFRFPAPTPFSTTTTPAPTAPTPHPTRRHFLLPPAPTSPTAPSTPLPELFSPSRKTQKYTPCGLASTVQRWIIEAAQPGVVARDIRGGGVSGPERDREREEDFKIKVRVTSLDSQYQDQDQYQNQNEDEDKDQNDATTQKKRKSHPLPPTTALLVLGYVVGGGSQSHHHHQQRQQQHPDQQTDQQTDQDTQPPLPLPVILLLSTQTSARTTTTAVQVSVGCVVGLRAPVWDVCVSGRRCVVGVEWVVLS